MNNPNNNNNSPYKKSRSMNENTPNASSSSSSSETQPEQPDESLTVAELVKKYSIPDYSKHNHILFPLRQIPFPFSTSPTGAVGIIVQNENGPCPLIAIFNALVLSGKLDISPQIQKATAGGIMEQIAAKCAEKFHDLPTDYDREQAKSRLINCFCTIPSLLTGLNINIQFIDNEGFEYSNAMDLLDWLNIRMFHTWVIDHEDKETYDAIGDKTYNDLQDYLTILTTTTDSTKTTTTSENPTPSSLNFTSINTDTPIENGNISPLSIDTYIDHLLSRTSTGNSGHGEQTDTQNQQQQKIVDSLQKNNIDPDSFEGNLLTSLLSRTSTNSTVLSASNSHDIENTESGKTELLSSSTTVPVIESTTIPMITSTTSMDIPSSIPSTSINATTSLPILNTDDPKAHIYNQFLHNTKNQTTIIGIQELLKNLQNLDTAIVFRNNHFYTVFKLFGVIYELVTDSGFTPFPGIVWQILQDPYGENNHFTNVIFYQILNKIFTMREIPNMLVH